MDLGITSVRGPFEDLLVTAAAWVLLGAAGWLVVLALAVLVEALSNGRWQPARWTLAPPAWRSTLLAVTVAALTSLGFAPAHAEPSGVASGSTALDGLPLPARATGKLLPVTAPAPTTPTTVVVDRGDSLWAIARRHAPQADEATLSRLVRHLHLVNRAVIGADPDVLHPGQRLVLPALPTAPHQEP